MVFLALTANVTFSQVTLFGNSNTGGVNFIGWDATGTPSPLDFRNDHPWWPYNFWTNNGVSTTTLSLTPNTTGADLSILDAYSGYQIANRYVLWNNGMSSNIYLGIGAGNALSAGGNTFVGNNAGNLTLDAYNVYVGSNAAPIASSCKKNVILGANSALNMQTDSYNNVAIGMQVAPFMDLVNSNVYIGAFSAASNKDGNENVYIGTNSGNAQVHGKNCTFIGTNSGQTNSLGNNSLTNATGIGHNSYPPVDNSMILGDNNVNSAGASVLTRAF